MLRRNIPGPLMLELRAYQHDAIQALRHSIAGGSRFPLLVMPTGAGKTLVAAEIIRSAVAKGRQALFLAPRRELVLQTSDKLDAFDVGHGILMAGERASMLPSVQIACVPTLYRRCFRAGQAVQASMFGRGIPLPPADLVVIDEAHANMSHMARQILAAYPDAVKIGMTATPARADGRGLGELYNALVLGPSVAQLTAGGYLVPVRYYGATQADLSAVRLQAGDYHQADLGAAMNQPQLVGDVVENWLRICPERQSVVFAVNRAHALALHQEFEQAGIPSGYVDGESPHEDRKSILRRHADGDIRVLCSVDVLSYGWDQPSASCAILARPTKSIARYLQVAGRVLRPYPGKAEAILIDHAGAVDALGFVDAVQPWSLDGKSKLAERKALQRTEPNPISCPACKATMRPAPSCPGCGQDLTHQRAKAIDAHAAELAEIDRKTRKALSREWSVEQKTRFYAELRSIGRERGYKDGWAANQHRERFGTWPSRKVEPATPSAATRRWVQSRLIRFAKARAA